MHLLVVRLGDTANMNSQVERSLLVGWRSGCHIAADRQHPWIASTLQIITLGTFPKRSYVIDSVQIIPINSPLIA